ncbi:hypothetical protein FWK35_00011327 [Aphis craccivora]|uniref:Uncharacterized protein n=1 Tax=Aphis craccivora TaxID=307492 RepID=A0A6G0YZY8_APHCR|nr:hypothetical protein FWK35_00011327 [Aphis craccivora]
MPYNSPIPVINHKKNFIIETLKPTYVITNKVVEEETSKNKDKSKIYTLHYSKEELKDTIRHKCFQNRLYVS